MVEVETVATISTGTDITVVIILSIIALMVLVGVVAIIWVLRNRYLRNTVRFNVFMPDGKKISKRFKNVTGKETIDNCVYHYDEACEVRTKYSKEIFFFYNIPKAINFDHTTPEEDLKFSGKNIKALMDSVMIEKLLGETSISREEMFIIGLIVLNVITIFLVFTSTNGGVTLEPNPENLKVIADACVSGFKNGVL